MIYQVHPGTRTSFLSYLQLIVSFVRASFTSKIIVLSLPAEVQYPYLFFHWEKGLAFINFAEELRRIFRCQLYWTNCLPKTKDEKSIQNLTISWDFVPKNIHLLINSKIIGKSKKKIKELLMQRPKLIHLAN